MRTRSRPKGDFDEIRTARLLMRRWREPDRAPFAALNADPEVMRYFPNTLSRTVFEHPRIDAGHRLRPHVVYRVERHVWLAEP